MRNLLIVIIFLVLLGGSYWAGVRSGHREPAGEGSPSQKSSAAEAPLKIDRDPATTPGTAISSPPPGTVRISPEKMQVFGIQTAGVEKAPVNHALRTVGRVTADETRVYRLVAGVDGWIRETYDKGTGTLIPKDERLASFYSSQFLSAQQAYIAAIGSLDRFQAGGGEALSQTPQRRLSLQQYIDTLESLGMSAQQIKELARTKQYTEKVFIVAPATGFILARNVSPEQRFDKGTEWYRLAALDRVWILADLFAKEARGVKPGMKARVTLPDQEKEFHATVGEVLPQFDPNSRTLKVRLELDNPGYLLRPDMFVDVEFPVTLPPVVTVPADAILDSGLRKTVFVDRGNGLFKPREVETGWRIGNRVEIVRGLEVGEKIVTSGTFLIDSESKLELAAQGMYTSLSKDPVCGAEVSQVKAEKAGRKISYKDKTYYFDSGECKDQFQKNPAKFLKETAEGNPAQKARSPKAPAKQQGQDHRH